MALKKVALPPSRTGRGNIFDRAISERDRKDLAASPLVWFQIVADDGRPLAFTKREASAVLQANSKREPRDFRIASRKSAKEGYVNLWIQFNPGYWERLARRKKGGKQ